MLQGHKIANHQPTLPIHRRGLGQYLPTTPLQKTPPSACGPTFWYILMSRLQLYTNMPSWDRLSRFIPKMKLSVFGSRKDLTFRSAICFLSCASRRTSTAVACAFRSSACAPRQILKLLSPMKSSNFQNAVFNYFLIEPFIKCFAKWSDKWVFFKEWNWVLIISQN